MAIVSLSRTLPGARGMRCGVATGSQGRAPAAAVCFASRVGICRIHPLHRRQLKEHLHPGDGHQLHRHLHPLSFVFSPRRRHGRTGARGDADGDGSQNENGDGAHWKDQADAFFNKKMPEMVDKAMRQAQCRLEVVADDVRRGYSFVDRKVGIHSKAQALREKASDQWRALDSKTNISRRTGNAIANFKEDLPGLRRRLQTFSQTPVGKFVVYGLLVFSVFSGIYLRVLYFLFLLSLFSPLLLPLIEKFAIAEARKQQSASEKNQSTFFNGMGWNPNANANANANFGWRDIFSSASASSFSSKDVSNASTRGSSMRGQEEEIIVDAEWKSVTEDEDDDEI